MGYAYLFVGRLIVNKRLDWRGRNKAVVGNNYITPWTRAFVVARRLTTTPALWAYTM